MRNAGRPAELIYTLGTSRRAEEDFVEILLAYDIKTLLDVRSFPRSKLKQFTRENLQSLLRSENINYIWLGRELGGFRKGGYEAYTETEEFKRGIDALEAVASESLSVIVCAERFPWKCHRRWIAREMQRRGWRVVHIIDKGKEWEAGKS